MIKTPSSSSIAEYGYEEHSQTLAVRYVNKKLYHYHGVPKRTYDFLRAADSAGSYISNHIKPHHKFTQKEGA